MLGNGAMIPIVIILIQRKRIPLMTVVKIELYVAEDIRTLPHIVAPLIEAVRNMTDLLKI